MIFVQILQCENGSLLSSKRSIVGARLIDESRPALLCNVLFLSRKKIVPILIANFIDFLLYNNTIVALHVSSNPICAAKITRSLPLTRSFGAAQIGLLSTCKATISYSLVS